MDDSIENQKGITNWDEFFIYIKDSNIEIKYILFNKAM